MTLPENAIPIDAVRAQLRPGMTSGQLADAVIARLGLTRGAHTLIARRETPGVILVERRELPDDPEHLNQPAERVLEMCEDLWRD